VSSPRPVRLFAEMLSVHDICDDRSVMETGLYQHRGKQPTDFTLGTEHPGSKASLSLLGLPACILCMYMHKYIHTYIYT